LAGAEQVGKEPIGSGDELRELAVEGEGEIDVGPFAGMGDEEATALGILAGVSGFSEGDIAGVPMVREAVAPLLDPAVEVGGGDGVGPVEQGVGGRKDLDGGLLVDDALGHAAHGERQGGGEVAALVLDDERAAGADKAVEAFLVGGELRASGVCADADDDDVPGGEIGLGQLGGGEQVGCEAEAFKGIGDEVAGAHDVGDAEAGGELEVYFTGVEAGGADLVIGQQAGVADALPAGCVFVTGGVGDGLDWIGAGLSGGGRDAEEERLGVTGGGAMECGLRGIGGPAGGKFQFDRAVGWALGMDGDADGEGGAIGREDAGTGFEAEADGGLDNEGLIDAAGADDALEGLDDLADADGQAVKGELGPGGKGIGREGAQAQVGAGDVVVGLSDGGAGEIGLGGLGVFCSGYLEEAVGAGGGGVFGWPGVAGAALKPDAGEGGGGIGSGRVDADAELLAGLDTARGFVGRAAAEGACALQAVGFGGEGGEVEAEQVLQGRLGLFDLGVEFEQEVGFGAGVESAGSDGCAEGEKLAIDRRELAGGGRAGEAVARGVELGEAGLKLIETCGEACGSRSVDERTQAGEGCVDADSGVVEEVGGRLGGGSVGLCGVSDGPEMVAGAAGAAEGGVCAAVLGLLLAPAFTGDLHVTASEDGVPVADGEGDISGWLAGDDFASGVVFEFGGGPLAGGVVEHAFLSDGREGDHGVDGEGLPGLEAVFQLIGKDGGIGGGFEDFLGDFAGDLVVAVAVSDAADEGGDDDLWSLTADGEDGVIEDAVAAPEGEGFLLSFGEAEVGLGAPELFCAVELAGS